MRAPITFAAAVLCLSLAFPAAAQVVQITTNVSVNTTWGPTGTVVGTTFWVRNSMAINPGVTLTIQPGVVVKFDNSRSLTVNGTLTAIGTVADTIVFTSIHDDNNRAGDTNTNGNTTLPNPSDWFYLRFADASPDNSQLTFCDIRYAGAGANGALSFDNSSHSITNCVIRRSHYGVDCQGTSAPTLTNTSIEASTQTPIVIDLTANPVFSSLVFSSANNQYDAIGLRGGTLATIATLPKRGATIGGNTIGNVTYVLLGSLTISPTGSLTVSPGVVLKPTAAFAINVQGALTMNGTSAPGDTITITSIHDDNFGLPSDTNNNGSITAPARGDWNRIVFSPGATGSISRCRLRFGTNSAAQGMIEMTNLSIAIQNSVLSESSHGLALFGLSNPAITNVAINNCSSTPVLMSVSANPSYTGVTFTANAVTAVGIQGEDIAVNSTMPVRNVGGFTNITYYLMNGALHMLSGATLTVAPGVVIKNQLNGGGLVIDGGLVADGTPALPIVFTSERDDLFGNPADTNGDGAISAPAQANWSYIHFTATTNDAVSVMDNCRITYASFGPFDGYNPALWITSAAPAITNTLISKATYGIRVDGDASPLIGACDINNCGSAPIVMSVQSDPNIATTNVYSTNAFNAIALMSETMSQSATLKYRPGVGSPTFAYLPTGTITIPSGVTLSIQPQVVIKPSSSFAVFSVNGALNCVGSNGTTGRVVFSSRRDDNPIYGGDTTPNDPSTPQAGDWGYILFNDTAVDAACILRNILFQFGSTSQNLGVVSALSANPTLARLEFFQNGTAMTFGGSSSARVDSATVLNCTLLPITQSLVANPSYFNITLANNQYTALGLLGETIAQDVRTPVRSLGIYNNIQYALEGNVSIAFGAKWTIDPGVVLKMGRIFNDPLGSSISIDGALVARGKPDSLIVFTSSPDDLFGQDMRSDGALTSPAAGQWASISFSGISNDTATVLQHCRFRYGGSGGSVLRFTNSGQSLSNCIMTLTSGSAVSIEGNSTPTFTNCQFDSSTNTPVTMSLVSEPVFTNVQFLGNFYTAIGVISEAIAQDVLWKIRPVAGRNNMPYLLQGALTVGLGATLSMQPGVIVKSTGSGSMLVQRAIQCEGRTDSLIVFTSYRDDFYGGDTNNDGALTSPAASDWNYITIDGTAIDPQVRFRNTAFRYGGSSTTQGALRCVNSSPSVDSCLFSFNSVGISVEGASNPALHGSSFFGNTQFAVNNTGNSFCVNAEGNWWGAVTGPNDASNTADLCGLGLNLGSGDKVSNNVDYLPFATSGIQNPLLGDVSLNGQVLAFDASLVLQSVVSAIVLSPLQKLVGDVSGAGGVSAFDATLILRYAAGVIRAFPAAANGAREAHPDAARAIAWQRGAQTGTATLRLGTPERTAEGWQVALIAEGSQPVYAVEFALAGVPAGALSDVAPVATGVLFASGTQGPLARVALAALDPMTTGTVAMLHFAPDCDPRALTLAEGRINEVRIGTELTEGGISLLAAPAPNPAAGPVSIRLALGAAERGRPVRIDVVDVAGRVVRRLHDGSLQAGVTAFDWDLLDGRGLPAQAGLYFIRASAGPWHASTRLTIVR